jgi:hypothetical protein
MQLRHIHVLKLLIMLEISLTTVIYKRIGKFWHFVVNRGGWGLRSPEKHP